MNSFCRNNTNLTRYKISYEYFQLAFLKKRSGFQYVYIKQIFHLACMYVCMYFIKRFPRRQDVTQNKFLIWVKLVWIQSFHSPKLVAYPSLPYLLTIARSRVQGFIMPFRRELAQSKMQTTSRIRTQITDSIIRDLALKTYQRRWTIGKSGEREGQGYPCWRHDMMMRMIDICILTKHIYYHHQQVTLLARIPTLSLSLSLSPFLPIIHCSRQIF